MLKTAVFILLIAFAAFATAAKPIRGVGAISCGTWTKDAKEANKLGQLINLTWVQGYISSYNAHTGQNLFEGVDNDAITAWMDNYCAKNPLSVVMKG
ncbi:MAG TPA: hypothetical protein VJT81_05590 [Burkholderiales bacterium]|nr:hypothetical protein [Burkholderiales bacterium]